MKKSTKRILIISAALIAVGILLSGIGRMLGGRPGVIINRQGISSSYQKTEAYVMEKTPIDSFTNLDLSIGSMADVRLEPSEDDRFYVEYVLDGGYEKPECKVEDDTLFLSQDEIDAFGFFGFTGFGGYVSSDDTDPCITLYIPEKTTIDTADIFIDYGDLSISECRIADADIQLNYGDADLQNCSIKEADIQMGAGSLIFDATALDSLVCWMDYGDVDLTLPEEAENYQFDIALEYGSLNLPEDAPKGEYTEDYGEVSYTTDGASQDTGKTISIESEAGDVTIR